MRPKSLRQVLLPGLLVASLAGCGTTNHCFEGEDYLRAAESPPLTLPPATPGSERIAPLAIPPVAADPAKLDPEPKCIDEPPSFFGRKAAAAPKPPASN
jgi:uncharacterized lipoprotein